jgi:amino acid transporter
VVVLLGPPNLGVAAQYFSGQLPAERSTLALAALLVWVAAVALALASTFSGLRRIRAHRTAMRHAGAIAVILGLCLLGAGLVHRVSADSYSQCCGSLTAAHQLLHTPATGTP